MNLSPVERILSNISELIIYRNRLEGIIRRDGEEEEEEEEESVNLCTFNLKKQG